MLLTMGLLTVLYLGFLAVLLTMHVSRMVIILFMGAFMFLQYFFSDKMILSSMGAKIVTESEMPELHQIVSRLCANADLPMPRIAVVKTSMPNAFATGRNQKNAVVAVTTGIMERLNNNELEAVLAHELTHVKNRDMMVMTIATFLSSIAQIMVQWLPFLGGGESRSRFRQQFHSAVPGLPGCLDSELHSDSHSLSLSGVCSRSRCSYHDRPAVESGLSS